MFRLVKHVAYGELSRVEDLVNMPRKDTPSHLVYSDGHVEYTAKLGTAPEYFSYGGWCKYLADNLDNLKFVNERAMFHLVDIAMIKTEHFIDAADLIKHDELTGEVSRLTYELAQVQELNIFTGVLFNGIYPAWINEAEFKQLDDYKYLSQVLDKVVDTFDHNFQMCYQLRFVNNSSGDFKAVTAWLVKEKYLILLIYQKLSHLLIRHIVIS